MKGARLLCRLLGHRYGPEERRTYDFGMRALKLMRRAECKRCGHILRQKGYVTGGKVVWCTDWLRIDDDAWAESRGGIGRLAYPWEEQAAWGDVPVGFPGRGRT